MIVQCPYCHYKEAVPEEYAGMIGECSNCGKDFKITGPRALVSARSEGDHPVICFVLGFFFSLIGILVAYIIDKKNVVKAVIGFFCSLLCGVMVGIVACRSFSEQTNLYDAREGIYEVDMAMKWYNMKMGKYPKDISALVEDLLLTNKKTIDPWGTKYKIEIHERKSPKVISAGPDKRFGTSDDISNYRF